MIMESIVTTCRADGSVHIAPMGVRMRGDAVLLSPFLPSRTFENIIEQRCAVINYTDDVRVFAGCLLGRTSWPLVAAETVRCMRLRDCLSHVELSLTGIEEHPQRPQLTFEVVREVTHTPFRGFNRAQAAVIEAAVLVSRLHILPEEKVTTELGYLEIAITKTAGPREHQAWTWLTDRVRQFYSQPREGHSV